MKNKNILVGERFGKTSKRKLAEYESEKYSEIPSFLKKYGHDENEDYSGTLRKNYIFFRESFSGLDAITF